jgi:hypothetical protein
MRSFKMGLKAVLSVIAVGGTTIVGAPAAKADEVVTQERVYLGPNRELLWSGIFTTGVPYVASTIVASESNYSPDRSLFIPIVGPWVDLAQRGGCPVATTSCDTETFNKVMLVGDGIFQDIGALTIISSFLFPERDAARTRRRAAERELHFAPLWLRSGGGLTASGTF